MDGESHGGEAAAVELAEGQEDAQAQQQAEVGAVASSDSGYEAQLARRDGRITELEAQVAEAADALRSEIEAVKAAAADERVEYELRLAGARSVKAARALRDEHGGDVSALKEAEPWLFSAAPAPTGATGLPNAGAASDKGRMLRRWERLAGLDKDDE